jgi:hypothetical protein
MHTDESFSLFLSIIIVVLNAIFVDEHMPYLAVKLEEYEEPWK